MTDSRTPTRGADFVPLYSSEGLQISQAWGPEADQYTIWFLDPEGESHLVDYRLGGFLDNYRPAPGSYNGTIAFARTPGNERIMYVATGGRLRRYDTAADDFDDTGPFPYRWEVTS